MTENNELRELLINLVETKLNIIDLQNQISDLKNQLNSDSNRLSTRYYQQNDSPLISVAVKYDNKTYIIEFDEENGRMISMNEVEVY